MMFQKFDVFGRGLFFSLHIGQCVKKKKSVQNGRLFHKCEIADLGSRPGPRPIVGNVAFVKYPSVR